MSYIKWIFALIGLMRGGFWGMLYGFFQGSMIESFFTIRKRQREAQDFFKRQANYQRQYQQYQQQQRQAYQQAQQQSSLSKAYQTLGISPNATDDEVRQAYRKQALQYHPDRVATMSESVKQQAQKKFQEVTEARDLIYRVRGL